MKKNEIVSIEMNAYTADGSGVGRVDGMAVFVPGAAAGDKLRVRIVKPEKTYAFGKIEEILSPSPHRVPEDCPRAVQCGGCVFRHISYEEELRAKEQRVRDAMQRIGGFRDLPIAPVVGAAQPGGYRNKAQIPVGVQDGKLVMGFYARHSHRIVPCDTCALQPQVFSAAAEAFRRWAEECGETAYEEAAGTGVLRHLYLRSADATGEVMACVVANAPALKQEELLVERLRACVPGLASVILNENREKTNVVLGKKTRVLWGAPAITDVLCGLRFEISPLSFYQVNRAQAERLYGIAADCAALTGEETLLDLYCGTGTIGLSMAHLVKQVIGVEIVEAAVLDARRNAERNGISNAEFLCADAAQAAAELEKRGVRPNVVVLDPPRKGCGAELVETVARMAPGRIVYVSCHPATLARDTKLFAQLGYAPHSVTPLDMFPRTQHVETVLLLSLKSGASKTERLL